MKIIKEDVLLEAPKNSKKDKIKSGGIGGAKVVADIQDRVKNKEINNVELKKDKELKDYQTENPQDIKLVDPSEVNALNKAVDLYNITRADGDLNKAGAYAHKAIELALKGSPYGNNAGPAVANTIKNILSPGKSNVGLTVFVDALNSDNLKDTKNAFISMLKNYPKDFINNVNDKETFENIYNSYCEGKLSGLTNENAKDLIKDLANNENTYKKPSDAEEIIVNYNKLDDKDKAKVRKAINANNSK